MISLALLPELFVNGGLAAAGVAAVSIPLAIHLLTRLRRQQQPWAAMRFLLEAFRRQRQRLRIEQWLLLLVRCLIVLVLGLALAGPYLSGLWRMFGGATNGRLVCLVIDDGLSTQALTADQRSRFAHLIDDARRIVSAMDSGGSGGGDRVALWTTARPTVAPIAPPTTDLALVRRTLDQLESRWGRSDWPAALGQVNEALAQENLDRERVTVFLLSDFSEGSLDVERQAPGGLNELGAHARIFVSHPAAAAAHTQIATLTPFRSMILGEEGMGATVPVELKLRRFASAVGGTSSSVRLDLFAQNSTKAAASVSQEIRWAPGQTLALVNLDVQVPPALLSPETPGNASDNGSGGTGLPLILRATLQSGGDDALIQDSQRYGVVELRRRLEVGLIDDATTPSAPGALRPRDWLSFVLDPPSAAPRGDANRTIDLTDLAPALGDAPGMDRFDAVMVLRPDLLAAKGWAVLKTYAQRGGLVWVFTPPTDAPALWGSAFRDPFGLDWQVGLAPRVFQGDANSGWKLTIDTPTPEPLRLLSADWQALLRPLTIKRRLDLDTRGNQDSTWLQILNAPGNAPAFPATSSSKSTINNQQSTIPTTLLASAVIGEGRLLFLATALDTDWSNLTTKPLFLPLMHETLRGVLGSAAQAARLNGVVCGDRPELGPHWEGTRDLLRWGRHTTLAVVRDERTLKPQDPLQFPGVYIAQPDAGLRLAVNPDADAGNTTPLDEAALGQWLGGLGQWAWLEPDAPTQTLLTAPPRTNLGWPLLWVTLILVLIETYLARAFSHAQAAGKNFGFRIWDLGFGKTEPEGDSPGAPEQIGDGSGGNRGAAA